MSAYLVSTKQIGLIAAYALENENTKYGPLYGQDLESIENVAKMFALANLESIESRYPSTKGKGAMEFQNMSNAEYIQESINEAKKVNLHTYTPATIAKMLSNYEYQSCETDTWYDSLAYKALGMIRADLVKSLMGYENADWGL